jgi:hypothetical protein
VTLGRAPRQADLLRMTGSLCEGRVVPDSIYGVLHRECFTLFPDEMFADLFTEVGRRSVPPMIVAVVMVLQRIEGPSDRDAVDRFVFDARWGWPVQQGPLRHRPRCRDRDLPRLLGEVRRSRSGRQMSGRGGNR